MSSRAPIAVPPTELDLQVARWVERGATRPVERALRMVTWVADEKLLLALSLSFWAASRAGREPENRRSANRILACTVISSALPHLLKRFVARERPDRRVVHVFRHGVPRSGNAWDSFPSGHALHLGALAAATSRMVSPRARNLIWPTAITVAMTRVLLLAHYPSDVLAGLALGVWVDRLVSRVLPEG